MDYMDYNLINETTINNTKTQNARQNK